MGRRQFGGLLHDGGTRYHRHLLCAGQRPTQEAHGRRADLDLVVGLERWAGRDRPVDRQPSGYLVTFPLAAAGDASKWKTLADVNDDVLTDRALGDVDEMWFSSKDGLKVQGWLVKPVGFRSGQEVPDGVVDSRRPVVDVLGRLQLGFPESRGEWLRRLVHQSARQYRVWTGFRQRHSVLLPRQGFRRSDGRRRCGRGEGVDRSNNLFICGGSGGGLLTAWAVGHTSRFAAAVSMSPVIDWHSFVGNTDGPSWY